MFKFLKSLFRKKASPKTTTFWSRVVNGMKAAFAGAAIGAGAAALLFGRIYYKVGLVVAPVAAALCIGMGWMAGAEAWMALALFAWSVKFGYEAFIWLEQLVEKLWLRGGKSYRYEGVNAQGEHVYG